MASHNQQTSLHAVARLLASGLLQLLLVPVMMATVRDVHWCILQGGLAGVAFLLVIPVLVRGNSWQKMLSAALCFFPLFNLLMAALGVGSVL